MVGAGSPEGAGSSGAVGGANGTCVLALDTGMLRDVVVWNRLSSANAPAAPIAAPAPRPSTARRLKSGMRAIMPWAFGGNGNAVPLWLARWLLVTAAVTPKGERRRYALVSAAAELLAEGGFEAVRHRAVARRAGLPLASTTYYFSSLDDLIARAVEHIGMIEVAQLRSRVNALSRRRRGPETTAEVLVDLLVGDLSDPDARRTADIALRAEHRLHPPDRVARNHAPQLAAACRCRRRGDRAIRPRCAYRVDLHTDLRGRRFGGLRAGRGTRSPHLGNGHRDRHHRRARTHRRTTGADLTRYCPVGSAGSDGVTMYPLATSP